MSAKSGGRADSAAGRLERFLSASYARNPRRHVRLTMLVVWVEFAVFASPLGAFMVTYYLQPDFHGYLRGLVAIEVTAAVVILAGALIHGRQMRTILDWSANRSMTADALSAAFGAASTISRNWLATMIPMGWVVAPVLVTLAYGEADNPRVFVFVTMGAWYVVTYAGLVAGLSMELALLPLRTEIARFVHRREADMRVFPFQLRLLIGLLSLCATGGWFSATFLTTPGSDGTGDAWKAFVLPLVVAATLGVLLAVVVAQGLTIPVRHLLVAMRSVGRGDQDARVPVTASDEFGLLQQGFNDMAARLAEHSREMQASRARIVAASDSSRRDIERNLHDGAQQYLVLLQLKLGVLARAVSADPSATAMVEELKGDLSHALSELRDLAHGLFPAALESDGLAAALVSAGERSALPVEIDSGGVGRVSADVEAAAYFCCLEAMQNAAKHAGTDARLRITLGGGRGALNFSVVDDGRGYDSSHVGLSHGLQNMADRVGALGGELRIESAPGAGTTVTGTIPVVAS